MTRRSLATRRADGSSGLRPNVPGYVDFNGNINEYVWVSRPAVASCITYEIAVRVKLDALGATQRFGGWASYGGFVAAAGNTLSITINNIGGAASTSPIPAAATTQAVWLRGKVTGISALCEYWYSLTDTDDYDQVAWTSLGTATGANAAGSINLSSSTTLLAGNTTGVGTNSVTGNMYAFYEVINNVKTAWFINSDVADPPATTFISAGGGQLWRMADGMTPNQFVPSQSFQGGLRNDFAFDLRATGMLADQLFGVVDVGYTTVRVSYQPSLIPLHPTLGPFREGMVVRSTAGFPATNLDGTMLMRHLSVDPVLNRGFASVLDKELSPQQWYYYGLFARYDNTSGWFKVGEQAWLNPGNYGNAERLWQGFPDYYQRVDSGGWVYPGVLRRLCDVFGFEFDMHRSWAATVGDVWDFEKISAKILPEASAALGMAPEVANGDRRLRTLVGNAMALRKKKGTRNGVEGYVGALTGYPTRAYEGISLFLRRQHTEWTNAFSAQDGSASATTDNHPGWTSSVGTTPPGTVSGQISRQIAVSNEGAPIGLADGAFYLRNTNTTAAATTMGIQYGHANHGNLNYIPIIAGHTYKFSAGIKVSVTATVTFQVQWIDAAGAIVGSAITSSMGSFTTAWTRGKAAGVVAPATSCFAQIRVIVVATMPIGAALNIAKPMFVDLAWRPEGIPTLANTVPLSSASAGDLGTYVHQDYYEEPREVKVNVYPVRTNLALNSDFTLNDLPSGAWSLFDAPTYGQIPIAYTDYADIIDAEPGDSEIDYADLASGLAPLIGSPPTLLWDTALGRLHINKTTPPYAWTLTHTYFPATDLGGMSAAIGAYSSALPQTEAQGYLTPTVGTATTPDPGPWPNQHTLVFKLQGPTGTLTPNETIVAQYEADPQRSYAWRRSSTVASGALVASLSPNGLAAGATSRSTTVVPITPGADEYIAVAVTIDNGASAMTFTPWRSTNGTAWSPLATTTGAVIVPFDSSGLVRIGAYSTGMAEKFEGRIYSVSLVTGIDPATNNSNKEWVPSYLDFPVAGTGNQAAASMVGAPVDASGSMRLECEQGPNDGQIHSPGQGYFLFYLPYSNGATYFYIWDTVTANWNGTSVTAVQMAAAGVPTTGRWQFKVVWNATTDTLSLHGRDPALGLDLMDDTSGWTQIGTISKPGAILRSGTFNVIVGALGAGGVGAGRVWRVLTEFNGVRSIDFDFRYLDAAPGTTMVLPTGQTCTFTKGAVTPFTTQPKEDGVVWKFDANDYPGAQFSSTLNTDTNADGIADGWLSYSAGTGPLLTSRSVVGGTNQRIVAAPSAATSEYGIIVATRPAVTVGSTYTVSTRYASLATSSGRPSLFATWYDAANAPISTALGANYADASTPTTSSFTTPAAPAGAVSLRIILRIIPNTTPNGTNACTFDIYDISVSPTAYTDPRGRPWTLTDASALTPHRAASAGTKLTLAFEWYDAIGSSIKVNGIPLRHVSPEYVLGPTEGRYELVNAQPPINALYGRLLVMVSNIIAHDTSLSWALIEDAPYPENYFNGTFNDGEDGDFYFAVGKGYVGDASPHQSPSVYYMRFRRFASGVAGSDALTQLMPRLLPFRRSFKVITAATGLYNVPT